MIGTHHALPTQLKEGGLKPPNRSASAFATKYQVRVAIALPGNTVQNSFHAPASFSDVL